jgi:hypothetical protein
MDIGQSCQIFALYQQSHNKIINIYLQQLHGYDRYRQDELRKQNAFYKETDDGSFSRQTLPSPPTKERKQPLTRVREGKIKSAVHRCA